jgi:hypothetical protein
MEFQIARIQRVLERRLVTAKQVAIAGEHRLTRILGSAQ